VPARRDSKLTRMLQSSLSGNSHMAIVATISPASGGGWHVRGLRGVIPPAMLGFRGCAEPLARQWQPCGLLPSLLRPCFVCPAFFRLDADKRLPPPSPPCTLPAGSVETTRAALRFATCARSVVMQPRLNEVLDDRESVIRTMQAEICLLRTQLVSRGKWKRGTVQSTVVRGGWPGGHTLLPGATHPLCWERCSLNPSAPPRPAPRPRLQEESETAAKFDAALRQREEHIAAKGGRQPRPQPLPLPVVAAVAQGHT
jgi:hypothetical protein